MSQKICIISFDHWNYDRHIVTALQKKGIDSFQIKIGGFKHASLWSRFTNAMSKVFLNKNPKIKKRQEHIIKILESKGIQDQILVINPEIVDLEYHLKIKEFTHKYIAYLYDSVDRYPVGHLLNGIFDEIYSFDQNDIDKYGFKETTNYNYISAKPFHPTEKTKYDVLYIASFDKRMETVVKLKEAFKNTKATFRFIIVGKKTTLHKIKNKFSSVIADLELRRKRISQEDMKALYAETKVVLDIVRENQTGLSFRVFEAMAFEKKIITNNKNITNYNFYNPNNILVLENEKYRIDPVFFETEYQPLPEEIFNQYTIDHWVTKVFNLS
jgi:hypothetical protein